MRNQKPFLRKMYEKGVRGLPDKKKLKCFRVVYGGVKKYVVGIKEKCMFD